MAMSPLCLAVCAPGEQAPRGDPRSAAQPSFPLSRSTTANHVNVATQLGKATLRAYPLSTFAVCTHTHTHELTHEHTHTHTQRRVPLHSSHNVHVSSFLPLHLHLPHTHTHKHILYTITHTHTYTKLHTHTYTHTLHYSHTHNRTHRASKWRLRWSTSPTLPTTTL